MATIQALKFQIRKIRKNRIDYECFECKAKFSVNEVKCLSVRLSLYMEKIKILDNITYSWYLDIYDCKIHSSRCDVKMIILLF